MLKNIAFWGVNLILFGLTKGLWFDGFPLENMPTPTPTEFPWLSAVPGDGADSTTVHVNTTDNGTAIGPVKKGFSENSTSPETTADFGPSTWPATTAGTGPQTWPAWPEFTTWPQFVTVTDWHGSTTSLNCPSGVDLANYTGNISVANNGEVCLEWSGFGHLFEVSQVPTTVIKEAKNYCRNFLWSPVPWCFVSVFEAYLCHHRICEVDSTVPTGVKTTVASADTLSGSESTVLDGTSAGHNATTGAAISDETPTTASATLPTDGARGKLEDIDENSCETVHQIDIAVLLLLDTAILSVLS